MRKSGCVDGEGCDIRRVALNLALNLLPTFMAHIHIAPINIWKTAPVICDHLDKRGMRIDSAFIGIFFLSANARGQTASRVAAAMRRRQRQRDVPDVLDLTIARLRPQYWKLPVISRVNTNTFVAWQEIVEVQIIELSA